MISESLRFPRHDLGRRVRGPRAHLLRSDRRGDRHRRCQILLVANGEGTERKAKVGTDISGSFRQEYGGLSGQICRTQPPSRLSLATTCSLLSSNLNRLDSQLLIFVILSSVQTCLIGQRTYTGFMTSLLLLYEPPLPRNLALLTS